MKVYLKEPDVSIQDFSFQHLSNDQIFKDRSSLIEKNSQLQNNSNISKIK